MLNTSTALNLGIYNHNIIWVDKGICVMPMIQYPVTRLLMKNSQYTRR